MGKELQKTGVPMPVRTIVGAGLLLTALAFVLPVMLFGGTSPTAEAQPPLLPATPAPVEAPPRDTGTGELDENRSVRVKRSDGVVVTTHMANYLWGVVAAEMPASFELEALKAQAVTARTYTLWKSLHNSHPDADVCTDYRCCQAWLSKEDAALSWGGQAEEYTARIARAVRETDGKVLCYEGQPIQAVFHSSSAGSTQDAVSVWGSTVPYLQGVDTPEGEEVPNYRTQTVLSAEQVRAALEGLGCTLGEDPAVWFQGFTYTQEGMVATAQVGGTAVRGTALRSALGLRSATFEVAYGDGGFTFTTTGYGHGVGMSQYGANALAREGKSWREIVNWYYKDVTVGEYP